MNLKEIKITIFFLSSLVIPFFSFSSCEIKEREKPITEEKKYHLLSTNLNERKVLSQGETLVLEFDEAPDPLLFHDHFRMEPLLTGNWFFEKNRIFFTPIAPFKQAQTFHLNLGEEILSVEKKKLMQQSIFFQIVPEKTPQANWLFIESTQSVELKAKMETTLLVEKAPQHFQLDFNELPVISQFLQYLTAPTPIQIEKIDLEQKKIEFQFSQIDQYQQEQSQLILSLHSGWMGQSSILSEQNWKIKIVWKKKRDLSFELKKIFLQREPTDITKGFIEIQNNQFTQEWVFTYSRNQESYLLFQFKTPPGSKINLFSLMNSFNAIGENHCFQIQKEEWIEEEALLKEWDPQKLPPKENENEEKYVGLKAKILFPPNQYGIIRFSFSSPIYNSLHQAFKPKTIILIRYHQ